MEEATAAPGNSKMASSSSSRRNSKMTRSSRGVWWRLLGRVPFEEKKCHHQKQQ
jgi:hypothetical protein